MDMNSILRKVIAPYAGTKRGREALLSVVETENEEEEVNRNNIVHHLRTWSNQNRGNKGQSFRSARQQRVLEQDAGRGWDGLSSYTPKTSYSIPVASTLDEARKEYDLVSQAVMILDDNSGDVTLPVPPFYGADSGPFDTNRQEDTDDDEWLAIPVSEWTLQDILKADQVVQMLLRVYEWATLEETETWTPFLAHIGSTINSTQLAELSEEIHGTVEIVRAKTVMDPSGRSSYQFRLSGERFPILRVLRQKEEEKAKGRGKGREKQLAEIREEIMEREDSIQEGLIRVVALFRETIDSALSVVARLDTIMARAAFGIRHSALIPLLNSDGEINVQDFRHPLLESELGNTPVPINLQLSQKEGDRALIISGSNGGGKTLAMKSFGVASLFAKLGIPIPSQEGAVPRLAFFDTLIASVGDLQSVLDGQSTYMAQVSFYANIIDQVANASAETNTLILLDELGSGTDQAAGGAIAQSILESLLEESSVRIVATTHSPRLKTLSFEDPSFSCAAVVVNDITSRSTTSHDVQLQTPTYKLQYGVIGDSSALSAAARCIPALPQSVLARASNLMKANNDDAHYIRTLRDSMQKELEITECVRMKTEQIQSDSMQYQQAVKRLALAYERHYGQLEQRLESCYKEMKESPEDYDLVGEMLGEIRVVRKQVKSDAEFLREQGLRLVPDDYVLSEGESVTIIAEGDWKGEMASVCSISTEDPAFSRHSPDDVVVSPSLLPWAGDDDSSGVGRPLRLTFKRSQLAIWDYESAWESIDNEPSIKSVAESKRKLSQILSNISSNESQDGKSRGAPTTNNSGGGKFQSSRERKANRKKSRKK